jgi:hypothetical protein
VIKVAVFQNLISLTNKPNPYIERDGQIHLSKRELLLKIFVKRACYETDSPRVDLLLVSVETYRSLSGEPLMLRNDW